MFTKINYISMRTLVMGIIVGVLIVIAGLALYTNKNKLIGKADWSGSIAYDVDTGIQALGRTPPFTALSNPTVEVYSNWTRQGFVCEPGWTTLGDVERIDFTGKSKGEPLGGTGYYEKSLPTEERIPVGSQEYHHIKTVETPTTITIIAYKKSVQPVLFFWNKKYSTVNGDLDDQPAFTGPVFGEIGTALEGATSEDENVPLCQKCKSKKTSQGLIPSVYAQETNPCESPTEGSLL